MTLSPPPKPPPIPAWAWLFAIACGSMLIVTRGGAIPGAIAFGTAGGCIAIARDTTKPIGTRIAICLGLTVICWALFFGLMMMANR